MSDIEANDGNAVRQAGATPEAQFGEPWYFNQGQLENEVLSTNGLVWRDADWMKSEDVANMHRVIACVNALAGIPNPQAFVREVRELLQRWLEADFERDAISPLILATEELLARLDAGRGSR